MKWEWVGGVVEWDGWEGLWSRDEVGGVVEWMLHVYIPYNRYVLL